jgi:cysteine-rich repeat protein
MRSSLPGLMCALAAVAIGCGSRQLDSGGNAGAGGAAIAVDAGAIGDGGMARETGTSGTDAQPLPDGRLPIWIEPCGNGFMDTGEQCDDGNRSPGDGCGATCQIECHWSCGACGVPGPCIVTPICGDGVLGSGEACDDANVTSGDGCSATCAVEPGWLCPVPGRRCFPICGDGHAVGPETCDDGNRIAGDGCSDICLVEPNDARCGDGFTSGAEQCDYGTFADTRYGGCTEDCRFGGYCGDSVRNGPEDCDLGAGQNIYTYGNRDGCAPGCLYPRFCGDGVADSDEGEQCDLGPENGASGRPCSMDCKILIDF